MLEILARAGSFVVSSIIYDFTIINSRDYLRDFEVADGLSMFLLLVVVPCERNCLYGTFDLCRQAEEVNALANIRSRYGRSSACYSQNTMCSIVPVAEQAKGKF